MRELFVSEKKMVERISEIDWNGRVIQMPHIVTESHDYPNKKPAKFNKDFEYTFYIWPNRPEKNFGTMAHILPRTLGAKIFLAVNEETSTLLDITMMGAGAFPIRYFKNYIAAWEEVIGGAISSCDNLPTSKLQYTNCETDNPLIHKQLKKAIPLKKHAYLRVLVVHDIIFLLAFPRHELPVHQGTRYTLHEDATCRLDCYIDNEGLVCFDGWLHTAPTPKSEWTLVAVPEENGATK